MYTVAYIVLPMDSNGFIVRRPLVMLLLLTDERLDFDPRRKGSRPRCCLSGAISSLTFGLKVL